LALRVVLETAITLVQAAVPELQMLALWEILVDLGFMLAAGRQAEVFRQHPRRLLVERGDIMVILTVQAVVQLERMETMERPIVTSAGERAVQVAVLH
jgi:hypothetical protein